MNKQQKNDTYAITLTAAARRLGVSVSTVQRLVRKGNLHATEPQLRRHHWTRGIRVDKAFEAEHSRRRKHTPNPSSRQSANSAAADNLNLNPSIDPSPIQTVTPPDDVLEKCRNAMNICLEAVKACEQAKQKVIHRIDRVDRWVTKWINRLGSNEESNTRCTAILAAACILQLILAIYYTLCHFNII